MAVDTPEALFFYELGILRDAEASGGRLLDWICGHIQNSELAQELRRQRTLSDQHQENIVRCLEVLAAAPLETPSTTVEGIRSRLEEFNRLRPSPELLDLFAVGTVIRFMDFSVTSYRSMVDWTMLMGQTECARNLRKNLAQKEEGVEALERLHHRLSREVLTPA
ncbi:hypothetical protein GCM10027290_03470 [Micromonospora sonneratiae]|uniref:DUF892 family protein n=1 Tax=Micromonospora sonneratiae TaxID=1184706 RepID=A0ABW3Y526_9ACTN